MYPCQKCSCHFSVLTVAIAALFQIAAAFFSLSNMGWKSHFLSEECWSLALSPFFGKGICLFSNLWAPVPVTETLLNARGGGHIDNLPAVLLEVDI